MSEKFLSENDISIMRSAAEDMTFQEIDRILKEKPDEVEARIVYEYYDEIVRDDDLDTLYKVNGEEFIPITDEEMQKNYIFPVLFKMARASIRSWDMKDRKRKLFKYINTYTNKSEALQKLMAETDGL